MKWALIFTILSLSLVCFPACKPKENAKGADPAPEATSTPGPAPSAPAESLPAAPAQPAAPKLSVAERAAKLGFARHLPADVQSLVSVHNGAQTVQRIKDSGFWRVIRELSDHTMLDQGNAIEGLDQEQEVTEEDDMGAPPEAPMPGEGMPASGLTPSQLMGREVTLAFGPGTAKQMGNLVTLQNRINYQRIRLAIQSLAEGLEAGTFNDQLVADVFGDGFKGLVADPENGPPLLTAMNMPPTYVAFLSTPEDKETHLREIASSFGMIQMLGEMVTEVDVKVAGASFTGSKIMGKKVAESMASAREGALSMMEESVFNRYVEAVSQKDLVIMTGLVGDYVVVFLGSSENDCRLVAEPTDSILAGDTLAFADSYVSKDMFSLVHGDQDLVSTLVSISNSFGVIAEAVRDGLADTTALGDTRDIVALLQVVADKEVEFLKQFQSHATGSVSYWEDGFRWESFGGVDQGAVDWEAPNRLATLGASDDVFLFSNLTTHAAYDEAAASYYEAILETAYAIAMKVAEKGEHVESIQPFRQQLGRFDEHFRTELINMWKAVRTDVDDGLGRERAWIVDLKGTVPAVPGIPRNMIDQGTFPRVTVVAPVADRAKLAASWETIHESATRTLTRASEIAGSSMPMQKPMSSEKNGFTTWFFSLPFFHDDFLPSVTVNDQWFAVSTSKVQALDLMAKATPSATPSKGCMVRVNFKALQLFLKDTLPLVKENASAWNLTEENMSKLSRIPDAMDELDSLEIYTRKEAETVRTSVHFKTR